MQSVQVEDTKKAVLEGKIHDDLLKRFLLLEEEVQTMKDEMRRVTHPAPSFR